MCYIYQYLMYIAHCRNRQTVFLFQQFGGSAEQLCRQTQAYGANQKKRQEVPNYSSQSQLCSKVIWSCDCFFLFHVWELGGVGQSEELAHSHSSWFNTSEICEL